MKIINPASRWNKVKQILDSDHIIQLKEDAIHDLAFQCCQDACTNVKSMDFDTEFPKWRDGFLNTLREHYWQMWWSGFTSAHTYTHPKRPTKATPYTWIHDVLCGGCHFAVHVYQAYAEHAYPEYRWKVYQGVDHSTVFGRFKHDRPTELQPGDDATPDACYDPISFLYELHPMLWACEGIMESTSKMKLAA